MPTEPDDPFADLLTEGDGVALEVPLVVSDACGVPKLEAVGHEEVRDPLVLLASTLHDVEVHLLESGRTVGGLPLRTFDGFRSWHGWEFGPFLPKVNEKD